jgi:hypothetical protein
MLCLLLSLSQIARVLLREVLPGFRHLQHTITQFPIGKRRSHLQRLSRKFPIVFCLIRHDLDRVRKRGLHVSHKWSARYPTPD